MNHAEALRVGAAERYLLGELTGELREEFEEHYFECAECALNVRCGAAFVDAARDVLRSEQGRRAASQRPERDRPPWFLWFRPVVAIPVFVVLVGLIAFQNLVTIPRMKQTLSQSAAPQPLQWFSLIAANSRGAGAPTIRVTADQPFGLFVDIPAEGRFASYLCQVESDTGSVEFSVHVAASIAKSNSIQLLLPAGKLHAGNYSLVVRGQGASSAEAEAVIGRFAFALELAKP